MSCKHAIYMEDHMRAVEASKKRKEKRQNTNGGNCNPKKQKIILHRFC